jgi:tetratricopeptide (TPR) repeat protein
MTAPSLWDRLRRARIVQVLLVYLGASWGVLQVADTLSGALALPDWVQPVAVILLLVGLVIIVATAWVQSLPATTAAEEAGERPTDWEIAPAQAVESLKRGRLPALTWGRAILGGVVALSMLFGGAGLWVMITGGPGFMGPTQAAASDAAEGIAVMPFSVRGTDDVAFWGEGMVDLLSTNLDGMGGFRTIDARTVLARWRENVADAASPDLDAMLRAAGQTGARYAIVGATTAIGDELRLGAEVYDLANARKIGSGQVTGSQADPMRLIDDLSLETMRQLLSGGSEELATSRNLADLTTSSIPALRAYLEGERHYRLAEFAQAVEAYERALQADTAFALALFRISDAYGWLESVSSETATELGARSIRYMDRLSPRNATIVAAGNALYTNDLSHLTDLREAVRKYPDDPEAWFMLAEFYLHMGEATGAGPKDTKDAIERAIALDPSFAPYYVHAIDQAIIRGEAPLARELMVLYADFPGTEGLETEYRVALDLYYGDEDQKAQAWRDFQDLTDAQASVLWGTFGRQVQDAPTSLRLAEAMRARFGAGGWWYGLAQYLPTFGKVARAEAMLRDSLPAGPDPATVYTLHALTDADIDDLLPVVRSCTTGGCLRYKGALAAEEGDWAAHAAAVEGFRKAAAELLAAGDSINARYPQSDLDALIGYGQLLRGELNQARQTLTQGQGKSPGAGDQMIRLRLAQVNEAMGRSQDAIRWYDLLYTTNFRSLALERRAVLAEQMGDADLARSTWRELAHSYAEADPGFPGAAAAREALARLGG